MLSTSQQRAIAEQLLGCPLDDLGYAPCPGAHRHTTSTGRRDFRIYFEDGKMPRENCFHSSCLTERTEFMRRLHAEIHAAERGQGGTPRRDPAAPRYEYPPAPKTTAPPPLEPELAAAIAARCPSAITEAHLLAASPIPIPPLHPDWPTLLLNTIYATGERILIFTSPRSQGQYIHIAGGGTYTLSATPGVRATPGATIPYRAELGAWFLCAPVRGDWQPNPNNIDPRTGSPRLGRRHAACVTRYPYAVLESDTIPPATWLRILVQLQDPIAAIYTSGGKSIHALIKVNCTTAAEFNQRRRELITRLAPVGADPAALTAVRLTRLPGVIRAEKPGPGNLQRLLYLNPNARQGQPIINKINL